MQGFSMGYAVGRGKTPGRFFDTLSFHRQYLLPCWKQTRNRLAGTLPCWLKPRRGLGIFSSVRNPAGLHTLLRPCRGRPGKRDSRLRSLLRHTQRSVSPSSAPIFFVFEAWNWVSSRMSLDRFGACCATDGPRPADECFSESSPYTHV